MKITNMIVIGIMVWCIWCLSVLIAYSLGAARFSCHATTQSDKIYMATWDWDRGTGYYSITIKRSWQIEKLGNIYCGK